MERRQFLKVTAVGTLAAGIFPFYNTPKLLKAQNAIPQVVWIENGEPEVLLQSALKELGGMKQFISKGDVVVVKPNIGWAKTPEFAATTNPDLVAAIVKECYNAGAKEVKVFDHTCNAWSRCYKYSQIEDKASGNGAKVTQAYDHKYKDLAINGELIKEWPIYKDYLEADKIINVPIAKHHSLDRVTLGLKNLMGVMGGNRGFIHNNFGQKLADINSKLLPTLTIIDAYRILTANGPTGGNLAQVKQTKTLIASTCTVSADYTAVQLFGHKPDDVQHIRVAAERGLNKFDLNSLSVKKVQLT
jgi:uncharacterized protein (DUF362 family)